MTIRPAGRPWLIHFFRRHLDDDPGRSVPAILFFDGCPGQVAAEMQAVLEAVAAAPPPRFSGGGKWEAMHGDMAGLYEVRISYRNMIYQTRRQAADPRDYRLVRGLAAEFDKRRTVLG